MKLFAYLQKLPGTLESLQRLVQVSPAEPIFTK